jgi:hypothetical protein
MRRTLRCFPWVFDDTLFSAGVEARRRLDDLAGFFLWSATVDTIVGILLRFRPLPSEGDSSLGVEAPRVADWPRDVEALLVSAAKTPFFVAALVAFVGSVTVHLCFALNHG